MSKNMEKISIILKEKTWEKMLNALERRRWKSAIFWFKEYTKLCKK